MDATYDKYKNLIDKYEKLAEEENPSKSDALYLRQEMRRCDHIINHHQRAQFNLFGRMMGVSGFGAIGLFMTLYRITSSTDLKSKVFLLVTFPTITGILGYMYVRRMHSSPSDAKKNRNKINEFMKSNFSKINDSERIIEEKLIKNNNSI